MGEFIGVHSARRGAYRMLCKIDDKEIVIAVLYVDHRAHVYRR
jgi:mRNA-degrading endonuclease RelE of RelBE toxin-antitoxin system